MLELLIRIPAAAVSHFNAAFAHANDERASHDQPPLTTHAAFVEALVELACVAVIRQASRDVAHLVEKQAGRGVKDDFKTVPPWQGVAKLRQ